MLRFLLLLMLRVRPRQQDLQASVDREFRVKPWDLDLNIHLNNAKYLKYLDKGRIEHILQSSPVRRLFENGYKLIVANTEISYLRSLLPFQKFKVCTRLSTWDHKYVYYEQTFHSHGELYAIAIIRLALRKGNRGASPIEVFQQLLAQSEVPDSPNSVLLLNELIQAQRIETGKKPHQEAASTATEEALTSQQ